MKPSYFANVVCVQGLSKTGLLGPLILNMLQLLLSLNVYALPAHLRFSVTPNKGKNSKEDWRLCG